MHYYYQIPVVFYVDTNIFRYGTAGSKPVLKENRPSQPRRRIMEMEIYSLDLLGLPERGSSLVLQA